jgi:hypothetical protein
VIVERRRDREVHAMSWFSRWWKRGDKAADGRTKKRPGRPARKPVRARPRRERYSGWNDPDLPTYGDPFDG